MPDEKFEAPVAQAIRESALTDPETSEGQSCVNRAFKVRKKNFVFHGEKDGELKLMVKLGASAAEVTSLAKERPEMYQIGSIG